MAFKYSYVVAFFDFVYRVFTRCRIIGLENVPMDGPLIIVCNHLALADPPLLAVRLGRRVEFLAKHQLFQIPVFGWALRNLGAHPVYRGQLDMTAMRWVHRSLEEGRAVVIFPEGKRSRSRKLQPAFRGVAAIAIRTGAPVLPIGLTGTEHLEFPLFALARPKVTINIGKPFFISRNTDRSGRKERDDETNDMMRHIARLLPEKYRGVYGE